jgi:hypothetical protein
MLTWHRAGTLTPWVLTVYVEKFPLKTLKNVEMLIVKFHRPIHTPGRTTGYP